MLAFILRRLGWGAVVVLATALIAFGGTRLLRPELYPGIGWFDGVASDFRKLFTWDLGRVNFLSDNRPMREVLRDGWLPDVLFMAGIFAIGVPAGLAGGIFCANRRGRLPARALEWLAMGLFCTPVYVAGLGMLLLFAPPFGIWEFPPLFEPHQYIDPWKDPFTFLRAMAVPWLVTAAPLAAVVLRMTVASIADALDEDYIRTAEAKGLSRRAAVRRHAAPASYLPVASLVSVSVPLVVTNMVLTEIVFNVPGVFRYIKRATEGILPPGALPGVVAPGPDYASLQIFTIYTAVFIVLGTLLADLVVARLDPRIKTGDKLPA